MTFSNASSEKNSTNVPAILRPPLINISTVYNKIAKNRGVCYNHFLIKAVKNKALDDEKRDQESGKRENKWQIRIKQIWRSSFPKKRLK